MWLDHRENVVELDYWSAEVTKLLFYHVQSTVILYKHPSHSHELDYPMI
jgi:hypothetical protein